MDTNERENLEANRRWTQIYADKISALRSNQENLTKVGRWAVRSRRISPKEMNELHPEIYNRRLLGELNRSQYYLRKSASICGSSWFFPLFVSIRVHSRSLLIRVHSRLFSRSSLWPC